jgi:DNA-binding transcriptional regulator LsrR (DeoR family)
MLKKTRQPGRSLTDEQRIRLVLDRMLPLSRGKAMRPLEKLCGPDFNDLDPSTLSRDFVEAFRLGLVEVRRREQAVAEPPARQPNLEEALVTAFRPHGLRTAVVFESPYRVVDGSRGGTLVRDVGRHLARFLANSDKLRDNLKLGIACGPGVNWVAKELERVGGQTAVGVTLLSLMGRFGLRSSHQENLLIDADFNACQLIRAFHSRVVLETVGAPAVLRDGRPSLREAVRGTWMAAGRRQKMMPDIALTGAGILNSEGQWYLLEGEHNSPTMAPVQSFLDEAMELCKRVSAKNVRIPFSDMPPYCPVGDVANHMFVVEPRDGHLLEQSDRAKLKSLVDRINERLLCIRGEELKRVSEIWLGAAGRHKVYLVFDVLMNFPVSILCTDSETCLELIKLQERTRQRVVDRGRTTPRPTTSPTATRGSASPR